MLHSMSSPRSASSLSFLGFRAPSNTNTTCTSKLFKYSMVYVIHVSTTYCIFLGGNWWNKRVGTLPKDHEERILCIQEEASTANIFPLRSPRLLVRLLGTLQKSSQSLMPILIYTNLAYFWVCDWNLKQIINKSERGCLLLSQIVFYTSLQGD